MSDDRTSAEFILRELLVDHPEAIVVTALAVRTAVLTAAAESSELIVRTYAVVDVFTLTGKMGQAFCHMVAYEKHVNLGFNRGTELSDPAGLLAGTGKLIRHVRVTDPAFADRTDVRQLIAEAVAQGRDLADAKGGAQPRRVVDYRFKK